MRRSCYLAITLLVLFGTVAAHEREPKPADAYNSRSLYGPEAIARNETDNKEVIRQARQAYYSLRRFGLTEFQANIQPNWELVLKEQIAADPSTAQAALKLLNGLHFSVSLDSEGKVKVNHTADVAAPNEQAAAGFKQIFDGMDQAMSGFFDSWTPFMLTSPFPEIDSEYQLQERGDQYLLTYKDGASEIFTTMTKEFTITEIKVSAPEFKSSVRPQFIKTPKGYVLTGYEANYEPVTGPSKTQLRVQVDYQEVKGLQLPRKLNLDGVYGGTPFQMELLFSNYQVKTR